MYVNQIFKCFNYFTVVYNLSSKNPFMVLKSKKKHNSLLAAINKTNTMSDNLTFSPAPNPS